MTEYALYAKGTNHEITQSKSTQFIAALTADLLNSSNKSSNVHSPTFLSFAYHKSRSLLC